MKVFLTLSMLMMYFAFTQAQVVRTGGGGLYGPDIPSYDGPSEFDSLHAEFKLRESFKKAWKSCRGTPAPFTNLESLYDLLLNIKTAQMLNDLNSLTCPTDSIECLFENMPGLKSELKEFVYLHMRVEFLRKYYFMPEDKAKAMIKFFNEL